MAFSGKHPLMLMLRCKKYCTLSVQATSESRLPMTAAATNASNLTRKILESLLGLTAPQLCAITKYCMEQPGEQLLDNSDARGHS